MDVDNKLLVKGKHHLHAGGGGYLWNKKTSDIQLSNNESFFEDK